jgi:tetratricopeptide (TPR) repeat protein
MPLKPFLAILIFSLVSSPLYTPKCSHAFPNIINSLYKNQADAFVDKVLPEIINKWSIAQLTKHSHSYLFKQTSRDDVEKAFFLFQTLGPLKKYSGSQGEISYSLTSTGEQTVSGNYSAKATFQNGSATIHIGIVLENKKWTISSFVVDSDYLKKSRQFDQISGQKKLSTSELEEKVDAILAKNTLQKRRNVKFIFQLAEIYKNEGKTHRAIQLYEQGLKVDSADLNKQFTLAQLLLKDNRQNEAIPILQTIIEFSESEKLYRASKDILKNLSVEVPEIIVRKKINFTKFKILLVPIGKPNSQLIHELRIALQNELGIPVTIAEEPVQPGKFDIILVEKYIRTVFQKIRETITSLQFDKIKKDLNFTKNDLKAPQRQSRFILSYLDKLGADGAVSRHQFEKTIRELQGKGQYFVSTLTQNIHQAFPFGSNEQIHSYIGVTSEDIGCKDCNFMYGETIGIYGAISYYRFRAKFNGEADNRPRLLKRLLKQALSSINFTFGIPRCNTPYCARAFPRTLQEHDAKSEHLCRICKHNLENYKKNPKSDTMAAEYCSLGERYLAEKDWTKAIKAFNKSIAFDSTWAWSYEGLGIALANTKKDEQAIEKYQKAITLYKTKKEKINLGPVYEKIGFVYYELGDNDKAFSAFIKAESLTFISDFTNIFLGNHYLSDHNNQKALQNFLAAKKQNPANKEASYDVGIAYVNLKQYKKALPYFEEAQSAYVNDGNFYSLLGSCYHGAGKKQQAIDCYQKAILLDPKLPDPHFNLGLLLEQQQKKAAIDHYKKATKLNPSFVEAYTQLGILYGKMGLLYKSIGSLQAALTLSPDDAKIRNSLGYTYYLQKKYNKAIQQYEHAIQLEPNFALAYYNNAISHYALKEFNASIKHFDIARKLHYPVSSRFQAALAMHRLNKK